MFSEQAPPMYPHSSRHRVIRKEQGIKVPVWEQQSAKGRRPVHEIIPGSVKNLKGNELK